MNEIKEEEIKIGLIMERAVDSFPVFVNHIFSQSTDIFKNHKWVGGDHIDNIADYLKGNNLTLRVSARDHFKSLSFYAHIMWKIYRLYYTDRSREINYFSYKESMAGYHTKKIKDAIACNPSNSPLVLS